MPVHIPGFSGGDRTFRESEAISLMLMGVPG
jgi:hypothetical protein